MIAWMLYSAIVTLLVAAGATALDRGARIAGRSTRWIWIGAMSVAAVLVVAAPFRSIETAAPLATLSATHTTPVAPQPMTWLQTASATLFGGQHAFDDLLTIGAAWIQRRLPTSASAIVLGAWLVASTLLALVFGMVQMRFARARRRWPLTDLHGARVRVAPETGPVVIGLLEPEIIVPRWMLERASAEQRVVVAHEAEHVRARDPLLLAAGWVALVSMPWNAALWFMMSRLRLAVELDCDARVLRAGVAPNAYGNLLIDLAAHAEPLRLAATALADDSSHLSQRILAMKPETRRFGFARVGVAGVLGVASLVVACATALPTDADIKQMDATSAEQAARKLALIGSIDSAVTYTIDGVATTAAAAKALPANGIASINISKSAAQSRIDIRTKVLDSAIRSAVATNLQLEPTRASADEPDTRGSASLKLRMRDSTHMLADAVKRVSTSTPIFFVDGERIDAAAFSKLNRADIESVEVLKGPAAGAAYGADAAAGVIVVKTKSGVKRDQ